MSKENAELIKKYDEIIIGSSLAKATRLKHLKILLSLTRLLKKDCKEVTKSDIDIHVYNVMNRFGSESGQETETSRDHKKVLKIKRKLRPNFCEIKRMCV